MAPNTDILHPQKGCTPKCSATAYMNHWGLGTVPNSSQVSSTAFDQMISHFNLTPLEGFLHSTCSERLHPPQTGFFHLRTSISLHFIYKFFQYTSVLVGLLKSCQRNAGNGKNISLEPSVPPTIHQSRLAHKGGPHLELVNSDY